MTDKEVMLQIRKDLHLTQKHLAELMNTSSMNICHMENGRNGINQQRIFWLQTVNFFLSLNKVLPSPKKNYYFSYQEKEPEGKEKIVVPSFKEYLSSHGLLEIIKVFIHHFQSGLGSKPFRE